MPELEKSTLSHYTIERLIARGGMSSIYLARDEQQRTVAIKVIDGLNVEYVARFQLELAALKAMEHKHILPIIDEGEYDHWHYYVMPYFDKGNLREYLTKGPLSQEEAGNILEQVASALQFAHEHGIIHRDIKASNILLTTEEHGPHVYLADFGLAEDINGPGGITKTGCLIGTPEYMAPELVEEPATTSSDIYALGILLYQLLTGKVPFKGSTPVSIYCKHIQELPTPPSLLNPTISKQVEEIVLRALEKKPRDRFKTVAEMALAYGMALKGIDQCAMTEVIPVFAAFNESELAAPTVRVIPVTSMGRPRRPVHQAYIAIAAVFFLLIVPLTLGFTLGLSGVAFQASIARGASAEFVGQLQVTPTSTPVSTKTPTTTVVHHSNQLTGNKQRVHKHKHRHGN
jgi:serine/threonine protein kinase